ncbi:MAG TPA: flagellar basal body P-ring formation chaperone FlgA [Planctomycetaceae bacterium]|nr:flagellar basal body P-ring formation chaperone FlgA [Planctomycetaceae bacterium]
MRIGIALSWLLTLASLGEAGVIELRDRVTVTAGSVVLLGDIAEIVDHDQRRSEALRGLPLGPAPATGRSMSISYDDVRQKLQARGENLAAIEFRGQRQVIVTTAGLKAEPPVKPVSIAKPVVEAPTAVAPRTPPVTEADIRRAEALLVGVLQRSFKPTESGSTVDFGCKLDPNDVPRLLRCRAEQIHFVAAPLRSDSPTTLTAWWVDLASGERQEIAVSVSISPRPQRLAVRHAVPKGFVLRPEDLTWVDADKDDAGLTLLGDAIGKETARNLRAGHPLTANDVASVPLMRTNDIVSVIVRRPGISVRREFKALSSAAMNETVSLVALNDPRLRIQATVTGYREATLSDTPMEPAPVVTRDERSAAQPAKTWSVR